MATLTPAQLAALRKSALRGRAAAYVKGVYNDAFQGIEDWWATAGTKSAISTAIDNKTSPVTLTNPEKRFILRHWCKSKFDRDDD